MRRIWLNNLILLTTAIIVSLILYFAHVLLPFMFG
ncbi:hypothetical protein, partial [Staphylococcus lugdunensis]